MLKSTSLKPPLSNNDLVASMFPWLCAYLESPLYRRIAIQLALVFACCLASSQGTALGQCTPAQIGKLIASDAAASDSFGRTVAVSGDTAVVGAYQDDDAGNVSGSAYVFVRSGGVWIQQAKLTASDAAVADQFGYSVALSGDTAVVGAITDDHAGGSDAGSAYVFVRSGTVWTQQAKLTASDAATVDVFGYSVALSGDTAVIGARLDDHSSLADVGSTYVFVRTGGVWSEQAKLIAFDPDSTDHFGSAVAVAGNTAVVGSNEDNNAGGADAGSAYVFVRTGGAWALQAKLTAADAAATDYFGFAVAVSSDTPG